MRFRPRFAQKDCNRSYSTPRDRPFKLARLSLASQYGTIVAIVFFRRYSSRATVTQDSARPIWPVGCYNHPPFRIRRPRRIIEPAYPYRTKDHDILSWPRPIRLVLTVPCATSVRPVPTVPVRRPCLARARPHALASATTRPCSCPRTSARMWRETARVGSDTTVTTRPGITAKIYSSS